MKKNVFASTVNKPFLLVDFSSFFVYNLSMINETKINIPDFIRPFLWSYDVSELDLEKDKKRIITNVLNYGTKEATDWLFSVFEKKDITETIENPYPGEWNKKSLHFWSFMFDVKAGDTKRHVF